MKRSLSLLSLSLILGLNGCASWFGKESWFGNEDEYLASRMDKSLTLPSDIPRAVQEDEFVVPGLSAKSADEPRGSALDVAPPKLVLSVGRDVLLDTSGYLPVVTFNMSPATLFERVEKFLKDQDVPVTSADPGAGVILTDWVEHSDSGFWDWIGGDSTGTREKFKFTVKADGESGKGSLIVEQTAVETDTGDGYQAGAAGRSGSVVMLNRYLSWYDDNEQRAARARVLAEKSGFPLKLGTNSSDVPALIAAAPFQRVWERVPVVLEPLGFSIDDKDQSLGTYFVSYDGPPGTGFFGSLAFWNRNDEIPVLDLAKEKYQIKLEEQGESTALTLSTDKGKPLSAEQLAKIEASLSQAFEARVDDAGSRPPRKPE